MNANVPPIPLTETEMSKFDPQKYLIEKAQVTELPLIYLNREINFKVGLPTVLLHTGPSGSGKDSTISPVFDKVAAVHAVTATSRSRRTGENEPEDKYIWMRGKRDEESNEEYDLDLIKEYDLVEHFRHSGNFYGLPRASLFDALKKGFPVVRTDTNGVKGILSSLSDEFNIIVTYVVPESYELLWERIYMRDNAEIRIKKTVEEIEEAPRIANYYVYNPVNYDGQSGLKVAQDSLEKLIEKLKR